MKMHVLDLGRLTLDRNLMVGLANISVTSQPHSVNERIEVPVSGYCIEHADGNILFDLGCNPGAMKEDGRWSPFLRDFCPHSGGEECDLPNRLEQLGLGPDDIRYAVLSHLHNDHSGCVEYFKKSKLIVHEDEFDGAMRTFGLRNDSSPYVLKDIAAWTQHDLDWHLVDRGQDTIALTDDVEILNFGAGHAHGMLGLHVRLKELGGVILASDAIYQRQNYEWPPRLPGVVHDTVGARRTVERIRTLAQRTRSDVWFGHDPEQFATLRKSTDGWYE